MDKKKVTEAQKKATAKYEMKNYDKILVRLPKGTKDRIKATGKTVNGFISEAVTYSLLLHEAPEKPFQ